MQIMVLILAPLLTAFTLGAHEANQPKAPPTSPPEASKSIDDIEVLPEPKPPAPKPPVQKAVEPQERPAEIDPEDELTNPPTQVRISIRVIEINGSKLEELKLPNPLLVDDDKAKGKPHPARFISDINNNELQKKIQPLVAKGCIHDLANSVVTTTIGRSATVTCLREPAPKNDDWQNVGDIAAVLPPRTPGFGIKVYPRKIDEGRIRLEITGRVTIDDHENGIRRNGRFVPGVSSSGFKTTIEIESGKVFIMEGLKTTAREIYWLVSVEALSEVGQE